MEEELFSISLNQNGISWIQRILKVAKFLFGLSLLTSIVNIVHLLIELYNPGLNPSKIPYLLLRQQVYATQVYIVVWIILLPLQMFFYYKFLKETAKAIKQMDTLSFNRSFRLLMINAVLAFVFLIMNFCYGSFITYVDWQFLYKFK